MGTHIAVVGNGRIGRPTAYTIFNEQMADEFSLVDTETEKSWAFGEELRHVASSMGYDVKINTYEKDEGVDGADLVLICPGKPRTPGVEMSRRDLVGANAKIIRHIAEVMPPRNPDAKWMVITNPVDAMATLFKEISGESFVISTGDHPDTLRFRSKLARDLNVPFTAVEGFVGGEHGSAAKILWSTVRIFGEPIDDYLYRENKELDREDVIQYVRGVSKQIVNIIGGTEFGPASGFRDIARAIVKDRREVYSIADSVKLPDIPRRVNFSVPTIVGSTIGPNYWDDLKEEEKDSIVESAKAIYSTYLMAKKESKIE
ncbi:MAG: lactate/malate family dehydrogenase [Candidatus Bathyarchaeia archaeon]